MLSSQNNFLKYLICTLLFVGCGSTQPKQKADSAYMAEIQKWHDARVERLKHSDGWLSLAGLFWLEEGENRFGSDPSIDIKFPRGKAPGLIGTFILNEGAVSVEVNSGVEVLHNGARVESMKLQSDEDGDPEVLTLGSLSWYIIKRGEQIGVRLKDSESTVLKEFKGINTFPIDPAWRVQALLEPYDPPKIIPVLNVIGTVIDETSPGALVFEINGETYRLDPIGEADADELFVIFADKTTGIETYGAGRYVYVKSPDEKGVTFIDFNKAYNPPCVFTKFATCPLPPQQNRLPIRVTAGEMSYENGSQ